LRAEAGIGDGFVQRRVVPQACVAQGALDGLGVIGLQRGGLVRGQHGFDFGHLLGG
jgi:hypothetical protein